MDHLTIRVGAIWLILTIVAAAFLGTEFIFQEIYSLIKHRRGPGGE